MEWILHPHHPITNILIVIVLVVIGTDDLGGGVVITASSKLKVELLRMNGPGLAHCRTVLLD